jgi:hypothetical protein
MVEGEGLFKIDLDTQSPAETFPVLSDDEIMNVCSFYSNPEEQMACLDAAKNIQRQARPFLEVGKKGYDLYKKGFDFDTGDGGMFNINPKKKSMEWKIPF